MVVVGGADEAVVADIQQLPQILDGGDDLVHILLGLDAGVGGLVLDLLAVLVGAGQEHHIIPLHPLEAGQCVTGHGGVAVADVQLVAGVVDGGGDVELFLFRHDLYSPFSVEVPPPGGSPAERPVALQKRKQKAPVPAKAHALQGRELNTSVVPPWFAGPLRGTASMLRPGKAGHSRTL